MAGMMAMAPMLSMAASAVSSFGGMMNSNRQGEALSNAAEYNAQIAQRNQALMMQNAQAANDAAAADRVQQERINRAKQGSMKAQLFKNIGDLSGTPLLLLEEEAAQGSLAAQNITQQGAIKARGYQNQADAFGFQAVQDKNQGASAAYSAEQKGNAFRDKGIQTLLSGVGTLKNPFGGK